MLAGFLPLSASAWNFTGHRLSACIAWEQLPPASREKVGMLLRAHPDYAHWTRKAKGDAIDRTAFIEASKELAELVIDGKPDGTDFGMDEETERLESLRKPFLSLLAKAQEES
jgi:hypothetical protein